MFTTITCLEKNIYDKECLMYIQYANNNFQAGIANIIKYIAYLIMLS